ncbi:MAG: hypothetical protein QXP20_00370 [Candidatus Bathyarchaeia archaeon]
MLKKARVIVLDASAIIMGYDSFTSNKQYTVPKVLEELPSKGTGILRVKIAEQKGKLRVLEPSDEFSRRISTIATEVGEGRSLSEADQKLLALALELRERGENPVIISDDYAIQNIAALLGIEYVSLATIGIRHRFRWIFYCPGCHKKYPSSSRLEYCRICGTQLKRKVLRKYTVKKKERG